MSPLELFRKLQALGATMSTDLEGSFHTKAALGTLTPALDKAIKQHKHELIALLTANTINKQAVCPVSPTGQHQFYQLTNGERKCLSCLLPMAQPEEEAHAA